MDGWKDGSIDGLVDFFFPFLSLSLCSREKERKELVLLWTATVTRLGRLMT
jgi:hypothetical protein